METRTDGVPKSTHTKHLNTETINCNITKIEDCQFTDRTTKLEVIDLTVGVCPLLPPPCHTHQLQLPYFKIKIIPYCN